MSELHIHERIQSCLNILNGMTLTGFTQFNAVSTVMKELAAMDRDIKQSEELEVRSEELNNEETSTPNS